VKNIIAWTAWLYLTYVKARAIISDMSGDILCQFLWCLRLKMETFSKVSPSMDFVTALLKSPFV
jgi:hypothetical protein